MIRWGKGVLPWRNRQVTNSPFIWNPRRFLIIITIQYIFYYIFCFSIIYLLRQLCLKAGRHSSHKITVNPRLSVFLVFKHVLPSPQPGVPNSSKKRNSKFSRLFYIKLKSSKYWELAEVILRWKFCQKQKKLTRKDFAKFFSSKNIDTEGILTFLSSPKEKWNKLISAPALIRGFTVSVRGK